MSGPTVCLLYKFNIHVVQAVTMVPGHGLYLKLKIKKQPIRQLENNIAQAMYNIVQCFLFFSS